MKKGPQNRQLLSIRSKLHLVQQGGWALALTLLVATATLSACEGELGLVEPKFSSLYTGYFESCASCHSPGNRAGQEGIETRLDFSTAAKAYSTLTTGKAAGLQDPYDACTGVSFITKGDASKSLLMATLDQPTRKAFDLGESGCSADTITDMTLKAGEPPIGFVAALKTWINEGAQDN